MHSSNPSSTDGYSSPLDRLLTLGEPPARERQTSFAPLGITGAHVPELIRMATDPALHAASGNSPAMWAPIHAWRALGELRATEAIAPLLGLLRRIDEHHDDWVSIDLPHAFAAMGAASILPVAAYLAESDHGEYARVAAAQALARIGQAHADLRAECVTRLSLQLANFVAESSSVNGFLVSALLDLRAVEAAPVMEQAFASGNIDTTIAGDWEDVQVEIGLKTRREHPPLPNRFTEMGRQLREVFNMPEPDVDRFDTDAPVIVSAPALPVRAVPRVGRNDPCPCGSRKKFKKCCAG